MSAPAEGFLFNKKIRLMGTTPKRLKFLDSSETLELEDMISNLPEGLIGHILSFLPTKYAVGTSALSTIWKKQWTLIPNLDFDDTILMKYQRWNDIYYQKSFTIFVYKVLALHNRPQICQFRLKCRRVNDALHINKWISTVLSRNIQKLDLFFCLEISPLPSELFTSSTLMELRLESVIVLNIPTLVNLPSLRAIHLRFIKFKDEESLNRFFSSCPVLEDLAMVYCNWCNIRILNISCDTLKQLTIKSGYGDYSVPYKITLHTPHLLSLNYAGHLAEDFALKSMEFLVKARVDIPCNGVAKEAIDVLAQGISNVQSLHLSGDFLETCKMTSVIFPPFCNIRTLVIGYNRNGAWQILSQLLESFPSLKILKLNDGPFDQQSLGHFMWVPPEIVPACLWLHLEEITFLAFKGDAEEMRLMNYLLMNGRTLKKFTVKSAMKAQEELKARKKLLAFPRGSLDCEVVIC